MEREDLVAIRPYDKKDRNFIFATWLKAVRFGNPWFEQIEQGAYYENYGRVVERLVDGSDVRIACLRDTPDVILGYSVSQAAILHMVFVKKAWRKIGIARSLVNKDTKIVTHLTMVGEAIKNKKHLIFNPFAI